MRWIAILALCACNRIFGLDQTIGIDAAKFDAPIDAPYQCPAIGMSLELSPELHQLDMYCTNYTASAVTGRAVAQCKQDQQFVISEGPIDGPLAPVPGLPATTIDVDVSGVRLSADGDSLFVLVLDLTTFVSATEIFRRETGGTWTRGPDFPLAGVANISSVTHGPDHRVIYNGGATTDLHEASDASGTWRDVASISLASLGIPSSGSIWLSPDGLRMIAVANVLNVMGAYLVYTDRPALDQPFRTATRLAFAAVPDPYVTEDCSRIYFSGLRSIFYAQQR